MTDKTDNKRRFGNPGTKAESELTVRITKMLAEVEQAMLSRNESKAKTLAAKVRKMIESSANTSTGKMQMDELKSIMLGVSFSRSGAKTKFGMAEQVMRDGSVHLDFAAARSYLEGQTDDALRYIIRDARAARDAGGREGRKFNYYSDLVLEAQKELKKRGFSRPGAKDVFAETRDVNRQAKLWLAQVNKAGPQEGLQGFHSRLKQRLSEIIRSTDELIRNPKLEEDYGGWSYSELEEELLQVAPYSNVARRWLQTNLRGGRFSRPGAKARFAVEDRFYFGQPERFSSTYQDLIVELRRLTQGKRTGEWHTIANTWLSRKRATGNREIATEANRAYDFVEREMLAARFGQPERFDASSLERGDFAEASKSPMLGKLLAAKAMPDGGWRAVQAGSDTLVISFEDADLARDFGRRVASKGYSATSPVATTGRYWNVEVKNGK